MLNQPKAYPPPVRQQETWTSEESKKQKPSESRRGEIAWVSQQAVDNNYGLPESFFRDQRDYETRDPVREPPTRDLRDQSTPNQVNDRKAQQQQGWQPQPSREKEAEQQSLEDKLLKLQLDHRRVSLTLIADDFDRSRMSLTEFQSMAKPGFRSTDEEICRQRKKVSARRYSILSCNLEIISDCKCLITQTD